VRCAGKLCFVLAHGSCERPQVFTSSIRCFRELLQAGRHRRVRLLAALLASAPFALVLADARAPALLASAPSALVRADARAPALHACAPFALVLADARAPALLASAPFALVLADARAPALLALAPSALVLADARAPALLASAPFALVRADTVGLLFPCGACLRCVGILASPARAGAAVADARCLVRHSTQRAAPGSFRLAARPATATHTDLHAVHSVSVASHTDRAPLSPPHTRTALHSASKEYALVSTLYDAFGQDLPCVLLELHVT